MIAIPDHMRMSWIPPSLRTRAQRRLTGEFHEQIGTFGQRGQTVTLPDRVILHELEIKVTGSLLPRIKQLTGSCLPPNAPVRMSDGREIPISDIKAGDWVVSHTGAIRKVVGVQCKQTTEQMRRLSVRGYPYPLRCTDQHVVPVWADGQVCWKKAQDVVIGDCLLVGGDVAGTLGQVIDVLDYVEKGADLDALAVAGHVQSNDVSRTHLRTSAMLKRASAYGLLGRSRVHVHRSNMDHTLPRYIDLDWKFAKILGIYMADGSCDKHRVVWSLSVCKQPLIDELIGLCRDVFGVEVVVRKSDKRPTVIHVLLNGLGYVQLFSKLLPGTAGTKRIPACVFSGSFDVREAFISGWFDGDGYVQVRETGDRAVGVTASAKLAQDVFSVLTSLGIPSTVRQRKQIPNRLTHYDLSLLPTKAKSVLEHSIRCRSLSGRGQQSRSELTPYGMAFPVVENKPMGVPGYAVWDIEVEHDHSFTSNGFAVHNCVGCGGARAYTLAQVGDVAFRNDREEIKIPFPFATYGVGRQIAGMNRTGEGSFGGAQAKAVEQFGMLPWDIEDNRIPKPTIRNGWAFWKSSEELKWSHPSAWPIPRSELEQESQKYQMLSVTQAKTTEDVMQGLAQGYGVTIACMFGTKPRVEEDVLLGRWNDSWAHQQCIAAYWRHPKFGTLFCIDNQWDDVHGHCPTLYPIGVTGSYWMFESDLAKILRGRDGEVYLHSNTEGFPKRLFDWGTVGLT